jgi:hypothetical protein
MKNYLLLTFIILLSCNKRVEKEELELIVLNKHIISYGYSRKDHKDFDSLNKKTNNIIEFKLTNNGSKIVYFNRGFLYSDVLQKNYVPGNLSGKWFVNSIFINNYNEFSNNSSYFNHKNEKIQDFIDYYRKKDEDLLKSLNYDYSKYNTFCLKSNFAIHPGETIFFEYPLHLPYDNLDLDNSNFVFKKGKEYFFKIQIFSDSTNLEKYLTRTDIKTIQENNYKVYHGVLESKNMVKVKIIK